MELEFRLLIIKKAGVFAMSVSDINAEKKWRKLPKELRQRLIQNVFCTKCFETTIVDYSVLDDEHGILLTGKCKTCGKDVARVVEDA